MSNSTDVYLHFDKFDVFGKLDFDKKRIRKGMRQAGKEVQQSAKKLVSIKHTSRRDQNPGRRTGKLQRSIKVKVYRSGFLVKIAPQKTANMTAFYPAFLYYGVRRGAKRSKSHKAGASGGDGWRIGPRKNYMEEALNQKRGRAKAILSRCFKNALN